MHSNRPHIKALQSIIPLFFCSQPLPLTRFFFNRCFLFLPLFHRTASPGSTERLIQCSQCQSCCPVTWQSLMCTRWVCQLVSDSAALQHSSAKQLAELMCPPRLLFPFPVLCSKQVLCSLLPNNLSQPTGAERRSHVIHSQPSSPYYCFSMKNNSI